MPTEGLMRSLWRIISPSSFRSGLQHSWGPCRGGGGTWRRQGAGTGQGLGGVARRLFPPQAGHLWLPWRNILGLAFARREVSQNEGKKGGGVAVLDLICPWL